MKNKNTRLIILLSYSKIFLSEFSFKDNDVIIGMDIPNELQNLTFINPRSLVLENYNIVEKINELFDSLSRSESDLKYYVNNFYDCSFSVFSQYLLAIEIAIKKYDICEIVLQSELKYSAKTFNYFLSEYESQGKYFYNREDVFTPFLVDYFKNIDIKYTFFKNKISFQRLNNKIRLLSVFIIRFYKDFKNSIFFSSISSESISFKPNFIYVVRSRNQYNAIKILTRDNLYKHLILIGNSITNDLNDTNIENDKINVKTLLLDKNSFKETLQLYFSCFINIFKIDNIILLYKSLKLNFDQSIKEIVVMLPGLKLYKLQLQKTLKKIQFLEEATFITTELKSPHAIVDCSVAKNYNLKSIQIMCVDQENRIIPKPVSGDFYIVDFKIREKFLRKTWRLNKIHFISNIFLLEKKSKPPNKKYLLCFFASFDDYEGNKRIINIVGRYSKKHRLKSLVKLHPRDKSRYSNKYKNNIDFVDEDNIKQNFMSLFKIAISFSSAVIFNIITKNIPLIYIKNKALLDTNFILNYKPSEEIDDDITYWIDNKDLLKTEFNKLRKSLIGINEDMNSTEFLKRIGELKSVV